MKNKLVNLIKEEDKKNPFKDGEIANKLGVSRVTVNGLRQELNIPDYIKRREKCLKKAIINLVSQKPDISIRMLCIELNRQGFDISITGVNRYKEFILDIKNNYKKHKTKYTLKNKRRYDHIQTKPFENFIGFNGSMRQIIKLAKAAVMYPPNGLHTLIVGDSGTGKNKLVEEMHHFAIYAKNDPDMPLVVFNCADYSDNPQLLVSQLFGYCRGSFTGAEKDKRGIVEKADRGILFLDEIHSLPPEGQEMLFRIIDKGEFSRLGESDKTRKVNLMIIGATTENIESALLITLRRRIPVLIEIPPLNERPMRERLQLIQLFFSREAERTNLQFYLPEDVLRLFLFYKCPGNVGQLKSDIQVTCAKVFLNSLMKDTRVIKITKSDLPDHITRQAINISYRENKHKYIIEPVTVNPNLQKHTIKDEDDTSCSNIYQILEDRMNKLKNTNSDFNIEKDLKSIVNTYAKAIQRKYAGVTKSEIVNFVGKEITFITEDLVKLISREMSIDPSIFNILCLHLSSTIDRLKAGKIIKNPELKSIKKNYSKEFALALKLTKYLTKKTGFNFPQDEAGFIALYLNYFSKKHKKLDANVAVIVITHGNVSKSMLNVAQSITDVKHGVAVSMGLNESPKIALEKVKKVVKESNEGKGALLLVDMGSVVNFGEIITKELNIPTRTISRVDTLTVIEAIRRAIIPSSTLDSIYNFVINMRTKHIEGPLCSIKQDNRKNAIITICMTGQGAALKIADILRYKLKNITSNVEIISQSIIGGNIETKLKEIEKDYNILLIVGTVNPYYKNCIFIKCEDILNGSADKKLLNIVKNTETLSIREKKFNTKSLFSDNAIKIYYNDISKEEVIIDIANVLFKEGYVRKTFTDEVISREAWGTSYIGNNIAVPHSAEEKSIIRPVIGVGILKKPLKWDYDIENYVDIVFLLAIKSSHKNHFATFYKLITQTDIVNKLREKENSQEAFETIISYFEQMESKEVL